MENGKTITITEDDFMNKSMTALFEDENIKDKGMMCVMGLIFIEIIKKALFSKESEA